MADPALLDSLLDGVPVHRTEWGRALLDATVLDAGPLVAWFPQALAFGFGSLIRGLTVHRLGQRGCGSRKLLAGLRPMWTRRR